MKKVVLIILTVNLWLFVSLGFAQEIKNPNAAGTFYPDSPKELSEMIDGFLKKAKPEPIEGEIFALISPHAGYGFSGQTASFAYKLIKGRNYKTVIIIGPSHYYAFIGASVYPKGIFRTPLGDLEIDSDFAQKLLYQDKEIVFEPLAFEKEHSVEAQLPFLQKTLSDFKIVPIVLGDCSLETCKKISQLLKEAIGKRKDVLVIASTDMYHGYDFQDDEVTDALTLSTLRNMDAEGLYFGLREGKLQLCGGFGVVSVLLLSKELGHTKLKVLDYTNSGRVTGKKIKGTWVVGYSSSVIDQQSPALPHNYGQAGQANNKESKMLNKEQKKKLLEIARSSIQAYLKTGKKPEISETNPLLLKEMGAFVTLNESGELRGCIGNLVSKQPLYLTVSDMAVEAAIRDPRFSPVKPDELDKVEIEISVLSPLEKIDSTEKIRLGTHGVLIKKGFNSGVFLPQVATETGWSKEEFLSYLCAHKAGLPEDAWKDKACDIYIFTADVFSEKDVLKE